MKWEILQSLCRFHSRCCGETGNKCREENCPYIKTSNKPHEELKLFVWTDFSPDYTDGLAFAIAENAAEAMKLVEEDRGYDVYIWGELTIYPLDSKIAKSVSGGSG